MHAGAARIVDLHAIHAEVMSRPIRMRRINERQRDERTAVVWPACQRRDAIESNVARDAIDHRPALHAARADLEQLTANVACVPQLSGRWRQQGLREMNDAANQTQWPLAERHLSAARGAKEIGDEPEVGPFDVGEEQRGTAGGDHAAVDFRSFEMGINRRFDRDKVGVTAKLVEERAEIGERVGQRSKGKRQE
jgi:hypothetical protein